MTLLTIIVPTYNRHDKLDLLLETLLVEVCGLEAHVDVLVSDNASTDSTQAVVRKHAAAWPQLRTRRNPTNIGADRNFCACIDESTSDYFWIMGDDDLPKVGVIRKLVDLLHRESPDLVYMRSEWFKNLESSEQGSPPTDLQWELHDVKRFAATINVWATFISGIIVNRTSLSRGLGGMSIARHTGTNLVQLGWVFPTLMTGSRFILVETPCVLATSDNTGGYALLTVFGVNFPRIVRTHFGVDPDLVRSILAPTLSRYLPSLVWTSRAAKGRSFASETPWRAMRAEFSTFPTFWLVVLPLGKLPRVLAGMLFFAWRVVLKLSPLVTPRRNPTAATAPTAPR